MNTVFSTAAIGADAWLRVFAIAIAVSIVVGIDKWLRRNAPPLSR
jgi:cation-transporting ATPase F